MSARQVIALGTVTLGALAALNSALTSTPLPAPAESDAAKRFRSTSGTIHYTESGDGPALLLVHSIGLSASSFEMRYLMGSLAHSFHVYTLDLLGFGRSERPTVNYSAELYIELLTQFCREVVGPCGIIAAGSSGSFALALAAREPTLVRSLVLSNPPPLDAADPLHSSLRRSVDLALRTPFIGSSVFQLLTARPRLRTHLREHLFANPDLVTESMVDVHAMMARQPNAQVVAQAILTGRLDLDLTSILPDVRQPLLLAFGSQSKPLSSEIAPAYVRLHRTAQVMLLERAAQLPHEEQAEDFAAAASSWFSDKELNEMSEEP